MSASKGVSQCVKYKIELVMVEGPPRGEDLTTGRVAGIEHAGNEFILGLAITVYLAFQWNGCLA